jgi:hypothetical protein
MYLLGIGVTPGIYASDVERLVPASSYRNLAEIEYLLAHDWSSGVYSLAQPLNVIQWGKPR